MAEKSVLTAEDIKVSTYRGKRFQQFFNSTNVRTSFPSAGCARNGIPRRYTFVDIPIANVV